MILGIEIENGRFVRTHYGNILEFNVPAEAQAFLDGVDAAYRAVPLAVTHGGLDGHFVLEVSENLSLIEKAFRKVASLLLDPPRTMLDGDVSVYFSSRRHKAAFDQGLNYQWPSWVATPAQIREACRDKSRDPVSFPRFAV